MFPGLCWGVFVGFLCGRGGAGGFRESIGKGSQVCVGFCIGGYLLGFCERVFVGFRESIYISRDVLGGIY